MSAAPLNQWDIPYMWYQRKTTEWELPEPLHSSLHSKNPGLLLSSPTEQLPQVVLHLPGNPRLLCIWRKPISTAICAPVGTHSSLSSSLHWAAYPFFQHRVLEWEPRSTRVSCLHLISGCCYLLPLNHFTPSSIWCRPVWHMASSMRRGGIGGRSNGWRERKLLCDLVDREAIKLILRFSHSLYRRIVISLASHHSTYLWSQHFESEGRKSVSSKPA